ncbi:hypothetical protein AOLI_G00113530 [Acnodon oligacanthus]
MPRTKMPNSSGHRVSSRQGGYRKWTDVTPQRSTAITLDRDSTSRGTLCELLCTAKKGPSTLLKFLRSGAMMKRVAMAVLGHFPTTEAKNHYVLAMDYFTKCPEEYVVPDESVATITFEHKCEKTESVCIM